jgi:hypothetical protein
VCVGGGSCDADEGGCAGVAACPDADKGGCAGDDGCPDADEDGCAGDDGCTGDVGDIGGVGAEAGAIVSLSIALNNGGGAMNGINGNTKHKT